MATVATASRHAPPSASLAFMLVAALCLLAFAGAKVSGLGFVFTVALPYAAVAVFLIGIIARVLRWGSAPVPFRITTTCGQQRSLPWIQAQPLDNPSSTLAVLGRMALEVLTFRSLFRNTQSRMGPNRRILHFEELGLWMGALVFHGSLLAVVTRHLRLFLDPVPAFVQTFQNVDGFFELGLPVVFLSTAGLCAGLLYLTYRRFADAQVRALSLAADYFPLFLLLGIATSGVLLRHFLKTDVVAIKAFVMGLVTFQPQPLDAPSPLFLIHLTLVSTLLIYLPESKLSHMVGVFLSPTRNLANNSRMRRHVNPWNRKVKTHTYAEWEEEFREKLVDAEIPLDEEAAGKAEE